MHFNSHVSRKFSRNNFHLPYVTKELYNVSPIILVCYFYEKKFSVLIFSYPYSDTKEPSNDFLIFLRYVKYLRSKRSIYGNGVNFQILLFWYQRIKQFFFNGFVLFLCEKIFRGSNSVTKESICSPMIEC